MQEKQDRIAYLFQQYFTGAYTVAERQELFDLINARENDQAIQQLMDHAWQQYAPDREIPGKWSKDIFYQIVGEDAIVKRLPAATPRLHSAWIRFAAAIIIVLIGAGIGALLLTNHKKTIEITKNDKAVPGPIDKEPGGQRAVLTLGDGSTIILDSANNGLLVKQGETVVEKLKNGQIVYLPAKSSSSTVLYNTMSTPRGGQYQLWLPDGSKVWLNAASSITYPTSFTGDRREVSITGEAYFEVASDPKKPFIVTSNNETAIEVLGTHFNINAYPDESVLRATLLKGSVKVISMSPLPTDSASSARTGTHQSRIIGTATLLPGQQAAVNGKILVQKNIDTEQVIAWKNGAFNFNRLPLKDAMRQLARWYDVEIVYGNNLPMIDFYGKIGRDLNLGQVLKGLGGLGVNFSIEGKTLTVSK